MQHVAVKFIQFPPFLSQASVLSSIPTLLTKWCSVFHLLTAMQKDGLRVRQDSLENGCCRLFIRLIWQYVCHWKADACTEVMYSLCLVNYLHLCDKFTRNCTCFNVYHFKGLQRSLCEIFLSDANVGNSVDSVFVSCVELH